MEDLEKKISELLASPDSMAQLMAMARSLTGGDTPEAPAPPPPEEAPAEPAGFSPPDPGMVSKLMGLMSRLPNRKQDKKTALLNALRPWLSPRRQQKLDRALSVMQMTEALSLVMDELPGGDGSV